MVDIEKVIAQSEENIRQALEDYAEHTSQTDVLDDVSEAFIKRLAKDNASASCLASRRSTTLSWMRWSSTAPAPTTLTPM